MKNNYWTIDAYAEAGNFETLQRAKYHCDLYSFNEKRDLIGTVIYHTIGDDVVSYCEITGMDADGRLTFGRVKKEVVL